MSTEQVANDVVVMHDSRFVESGVTENVLHHPSDGYSQRLIAAVPCLNWRPTLRSRG